MSLKKPQLNFPHRQIFWVKFYFIKINVRINFFKKCSMQKIFVLIYSHIYNNRQRSSGMHYFLTLPKYMHTTKYLRVRQGSLTIMKPLYHIQYHGGVHKYDTLSYQATIIKMHSSRASSQHTLIRLATTYYKGTTGWATSTILKVVSQLAHFENATTIQAFFLQLYTNTAQSGLIK